MSNLVHEPLKGLTGRFEAEWHPQEFEEAKWGDDCRLRNVLFGHLDLMVGFHQIDRCEHTAAVEVECEVMQVRDGIAIRSGLRINPAVVAAWAPVSIVLSNQMQRR